MTENTKEKKEHSHAKHNKSDGKRYDDLESKVTKLETKLTETENNWKRALADYQNLQKRTAEERLHFLTYSNISIIRRLLPVLDNLEMLKEHIGDEGLKMIVHEYKKVLEEEGVKEIDVLGKYFDPGMMEAVETVEGEKDKVIEIVQKGYFLKDKLIRPARVNVGHGNTKEE